MTFRIANPVLALAVRLIARLIEDRRARPADSFVVAVDVGNLNDETASRAMPHRGKQVVALVDRMEPDPMTPRLDLAVHDRPVGGPLETPGSEAKNIDQEVMFGLDVDAHQERQKVAHLGIHVPILVIRSMLPNWACGIRRREASPNDAAGMTRR
jgi:hypothetical protein